MTRVPTDIADLQELTILNLSVNAITALPHEIGSLSKLKVLWLANTRLTAIPGSVGHLRGLTKLSLHGSDLGSWPFVVLEMPNLEELILSNTGIREVPPSIRRLQNLVTLDLEGNNIREVPQEVALLPRLKELVVNSSEVVDPPPEIVERGTAAIQGYFEALLTSETKQLFEAKLIVVGEGEVGKTCLTSKLIDPTFNIVTDQDQVATTRGVAIQPWVLPTDHTESFKINIWDFGGQEIYHATHQFFLTKRSLYIFVWDARKEDRLGGFDYWLNVVQLLSGNSPILIVLNKADMRVREIDQGSLQRKFVNIIGFHKVSALTGEGIQGLTEDIRAIITTLPHVGDSWPAPWTRVRESLEEDMRDYIDYQEYLRICEREGLNRSQAVKCRIFCSFSPGPVRLRLSA